MTMNEMLEKVCNGENSPAYELLNLIENNNKMLKNRQNERKTLTEKLWDFIANNKLRVIINSYKKDIEGKNKGVLKLKLNKFQLVNI